MQQKKRQREEKNFARPRNSPQARDFYAKNYTFFTAAPAVKEQQELWNHRFHRLSQIPERIREGEHRLLSSSSRAAIPSSSCLDL